MNSHRRSPSLTSLSAALILASLLLAQVAEALSISPVIRNPANGHFYVLLGQNTWTASQTEALAWGGRLVTINDQAEQDWVFNTFGSYAGQSRLLWIGLTDVGHEERFTWVSGETNTFTAWGPGEPNSIPGEDYVAIFYPGHSAENRWNDWGNVASDPIGLPFNGVVEIDPDLVATNLVPLGSTWRYLNNGTDQGTGWRALDFNDSTWAAGPAQLGYGEGDEATQVPYGSNPANKPITTYFRHKFSLPSLPSTFTRLRIQWLRDDGGIVYLNGVEVYRSNMPGGAVNYRTLSSTTAQGADEIGLHSRFIPMSALQAGTNVIAVEVHQAAADSTDLSFDLELSAVGNRPPLIAIVEPIHNSIVSTGTPVTLQVHTGDDFSVTNVSYFIDGMLIARSATAPFTIGWTHALPGTFQLVAVATDSDGLSTTSAPVTFVAVPPLVAQQSAWQYSDRGVDLGTSWRSLGYDDSGWSNGLAELGYGDDDEATVVSFGSNDQSKHPTTYFRQRFVVNAAAQYTNLLLRLLRDDGGIVYLNGTEVFRSNMPDGPVTYATLASGGAPNETRFYETQVVSSLLREGTNVIAVEIHQATLDSSDLSFDLELLGLSSQTWPVISAERLGAKVQLRWPATAEGYLLETSLDPASGTWQPSAVPLTTNGLFIQAIITASDNQRYFRLHR